MTNNAREFIPAADIREIYRFLKNTKPTDVITHSSISKLVGYNILRRRWVMDTARKLLIEEEGIRFGSIRNIGLKHLTGFDILEEGRKNIRKVKRSGTRYEKWMKCVKSDDFDKLDKDQKNQFCLQTSFFSFIGEIGERKQISTLRNSLGSRNVIYPFKKILKIFLEK